MPIDSIQQPHHVGYINQSRDATPRCELVTFIWDYGSVMHRTIRICFLQEHNLVATREVVIWFCT
jgi:hypothetical protein